MHKNTAKAIKRHQCDTHDSFVIVKWRTLPSALQNDLLISKVSKQLIKLIFYRTKCNMHCPVNPSNSGVIRCSCRLLKFISHCSWSEKIIKHFDCLSVEHRCWVCFRHFGFIIEDTTAIPMTSTP